MEHNAKTENKKAKIKKLLEVFNNVDNIFEGKREDYEKLSFLKQEDVKKLCERNFSEACLFGLR